MIEPNGQVKLWSAPPVWQGETIVCAGCGPSLTVEQLEECRETARIIVINDAYKLAPMADVLYACDARWWAWNEGAPQFFGIRVGLGWDGVEGKLYPQWKNERESFNSVSILASTGQTGLETEDRRGLRNGSNSGYQAINLAIHLGAKRIVLIGYDMKKVNGKDHFFGNRDPLPSPPYKLFLKAFKTMREPLKELGIEVLNATPNSALKVFPRVSLMEAL